MTKDKTVYVGLSGGVDSAVTALLLKEQGFRVVGAHMKNWTKDIAGFQCPWREDYQAAKQVAAHLDIEFKLLDFQEQYFAKVVQYMLDEFKAGLTPNPDVMCNQEIKFKLFLEAALEQGADYIATGHYAKVAHSEDKSTLELAKDEDKDQTYFLYRISQAALQKSLFPLGEYSKTQVRELASKAKLPNASRAESMGICFVGKIGIKEFLKQYVQTSPGPIVDDAGLVIGEHDGAIFYTIGQRQGLGVGGGLPYYVTHKDMAKNTVYVTKKLDSQMLWSSSINLTSLHSINEPLEDFIEQKLLIRTRHRAPLQACRLQKVNEGVRVLLDEPLKALTPGQSAVLYHNETVLGGGIISVGSESKE